MDLVCSFTGSPSCSGPGKYLPNAGVQEGTNHGRGRPHSSDSGHGLSLLQAMCNRPTGGLDRGGNDALLPWLLGLLAGVWTFCRGRDLVRKCARPGRCGNSPRRGAGGPFSLIEEHTSRQIWGTGVWGLSGSRIGGPGSGLT